MHASSAPHQPQRRLARQVRERLVEGLCRGQVDIDKVLLEFFSNLMAQTGTQREMQQRRDAWQSFQQHSGDWMRNVAEAWRSALTETPSSQRGSGFNASELSFELVDDDLCFYRRLSDICAFSRSSSPVGPGLPGPSVHRFLLWACPDFSLGYHVFL